MKMLKRVSDCDGDIQERVYNALALAKAGFMAMCALDPDQLPADPVDSMQLRLCRWQIANFGSPSDAEIGLGVIEELGEAYESDQISQILDGIADLQVYAGNICMANRMVLSPIQALGNWLFERTIEGIEDAPDAIVVAGRLAHVILKHTQKIRDLADPDKYLPNLVWSLGRMIADARAVASFTSDGNMRYADELGGPDDTLLARVYIEVGNQVVLKRNWKADAINGGEMPTGWTSDTE